MSTHFRLERTSPRQLFPFPEDGRLVEENPVCLCWIPPEENSLFEVVVYSERRAIFRTRTDKCYTLVTLPGPGRYTWNIFCEGEERGELSFTLSENAVPIKRVGAEELFSHIPDVRPRHLFFAGDIEEIVRTHPDELEVLRRNIGQAYRDGMPERPLFHRDPKALPYREYFGRFRDYIDRNLVALSLGYALLGDEKAGAFARELLLCVCDWNPHGPCSVTGSWGDEIGLSMARCLPSVLDLLWPLLRPGERRYAADTVRTYALQCLERLKGLDYCQNPGESHAGRLPAYLGEAALVLKGTGAASDEELIGWLSYAQEIYGGIFPYYGTPDGGWAEGPFYASSYTKWYLPFFSAVERYGGTRFLDRPFYQRLTNFFLHFANPAMENHPFGDGYWCHPEDAEWPGFFAQSPCRFYADRFGPPAARAMAKASAKPQLYLLHLLDIFLPASRPPSRLLTHEASGLAVFADAGFVCMSTDRTDPAGGLTVLARASRFGSDSHRHADQGSFALFYRGIALISPSGYFGRAYGTAHHFGWLRQTVAHNAILIDGVGQEANSLTSRGRIVSCTDTGDGRQAVLDLSPAYASLTKWIRTIVLRGSDVLITDDIEADHDVRVTWPLHTLSAPRAEGNTVLVERSGIRLRITPENSLILQKISDRFGVDLNEGVPEEFAVEMPPQWHIDYESPKAASHRITVRFTVEEIAD